MDGTRLKFESWEVRTHTQNAPKNHLFLLSEISESWNPDVARKVPPMLLFSKTPQPHVLFSVWEGVFACRCWWAKYICQSEGGERSVTQQLQATWTSWLILCTRNPKSGHHVFLTSEKHSNGAIDWLIPNKTFKITRGAHSLMRDISCNQMKQDVFIWISYLVNWCFESSQPLGIISGLKETFIKKRIVERTNKAEIRPEKQSEKIESCPENLWNEIQFSKPQRHKQTQEQNKKEQSEQARLVYVTHINCNIPTTWRWARGDYSFEQWNQTQFIVHCASQHRATWW